MFSTFFAFVNRVVQIIRQSDPNEQQTDQEEQQQEEIAQAIDEIEEALIADDASQSPITLEKIVPDTEQEDIISAEERTTLDGEASSDTASPPSDTKTNRTMTRSSQLFPVSHTPKIKDEAVSHEINEEHEVDERSNVHDEYLTAEQVQKRQRALASKNFYAKNDAPSTRSPQSFSPPQPTQSVHAHQAFAPPPQVKPSFPAGTPLARYQEGSAEYFVRQAPSLSENQHDSFSFSQPTMDPHDPEQRMTPSADELYTESEATRLPAAPPPAPIVIPPTYVAPPPSIPSIAETKRLARRAAVGRLMKFKDSPMEEGASPLDPDLPTRTHQQEIANRMGSFLGKSHGPMSADHPRLPPRHHQQGLNGMPKSPENEYGVNKLLEIGGRRGRRKKPEIVEDIIEPQSHAVVAPLLKTPPLRVQQGDYLRIWGHYGAEQSYFNFGSLVRASKLTENLPVWWDHLEWVEHVAQTELSKHQQHETEEEKTQSKNFKRLLSPQVNEEDQDRMSKDKVRARERNVAKQFDSTSKKKQIPTASVYQDDHTFDQASRENYSAHNETQSDYGSHNQSHNQSYDQSHNQSYDQSHNQSYDQSHNQSYDQSHNQSYDQSHNQSHNQSYDQSAVAPSSTYSHNSNSVSVTSTSSPSSPSSTQTLPSASRSQSNNFGLNDTMHIGRRGRRGRNRKAKQNTSQQTQPVKKVVRGDVRTTNEHNYPPYILISAQKLNQPMFDYKEIKRLFMGQKVTEDSFVSSNVLVFPKFHPSTNWLADVIFNINTKTLFKVLDQRVKRKQLAKYTVVTTEQEMLETLQNDPHSVACIDASHTITKELNQLFRYKVSNS